MDKNKKEVMKHLENTHGRLANRITSLEKKTKDQISYLSNSMKENIAQVKIYKHEYLIRSKLLIAIFGALKHGKVNVNNFLIVNFRNELNVKIEWRGVRYVIELLWIDTKP